MAAPKSPGDLTVVIPAFSIAANLPSAVPEPPDAIEPGAPPAPPDPAQVIHAQTVTEKQAKKHTKAKAHRRKPVTGMTPAQRRAQIVELELTDAKDVQKQFGGSLRRAQMDLAAVKGEGQ